MTDLLLPPVARPNYFTGEALLTDDFICEQSFQIGSLAAVNASLHTYGIASGLDVEWFPDSQPRQVHVSPGMAIDRLGRQIVLAEPQLIVLGEVVAGATYYLTISYDEVYGGLTDESGVQGYKRVIQQPRIRYERTLREAGLNILLAVLTLSDQSTIASLAYRAGNQERRYVGGRFGSLSLVTEGSGIFPGSRPAADGAAAESVTFTARRESDRSGNDFLQVESPRSQFSGPLTTRAAIGIGLDHPTASFDLTTVTLKSRGTFTSDGKLLTLSEAIVPPLQPGDMIVPDVAPAFAPNPARVTIEEAIGGGLQYKVDRAFDPKITRPTHFTYVRATLVRVADPTVGDIMRVTSDGTLSLGARAAPASGTPGPAALTITGDRRVGIGLTGSAVPKASLQVAGDILTDGLISNGAVQAQSFEGNGSKLTNLSFLSYWVKTNVADPNSPIYYPDGNVGVYMRHPPATVSAGTRPAFIGTGLISTDPEVPTTLKGTQTLFTSEVVLGDVITVGKLEAQQSRVTRILDDTSLAVDRQFSTVMQKSKYKILTAGQAQSTDGPGTISTNGTSIYGIGTSFTALKVGDSLEIEAFEPNPGLDASAIVQTIKGDGELTVQFAGDRKSFEANLSAYMISSRLMGYFQANEGQPLDPSTLPAPALIVRNNGDGAVAANTVSINTHLADTDPDYALQVTGPVNFAGPSHLTDLTVETLTATKSITVAGDGTAPALMTVGEANAEANLLTITNTNVEIAAPAGTAGPLLSVGGDVAATGAVGAASVSTKGAIAAGGALSGQSLSVQGVTVGSDQTVSLFGNRVPYSDSDLTSGGTTFTQTAETDGFVTVFLGENQSSPKAFASAVTVTTSAGGAPTNVMSTIAWGAVVSTGKKSDALLMVFGNLTVPVRKGETWTLTKTFDSTGGLPSSPLLFYWTPLGRGSSAVPMDGGTPPAVMAAVSALREQHERVLAGGPLGQAGAGLQASDPAVAQAAIDARVGDLTQILADATGMVAEPDARAKFQHDLQAIVCRADTPPADEPKAVSDAAIETLIDTFGAVTGRTFDPEQRTMLGAGVRALVQINDTAQSRQDLELIRTNIGFFIEKMEQVLQHSFDTGQKRLLTRALVRLVGDGSRTLPEAGGDPSAPAR
jgi:hypothetical protein